MRLYTLVLFMLCFSLVNSLVSDMGLFPDGTAVAIVDEELYKVQAEELSDKMVNVSGDVTPDLGINFGLIGFALKAGGILVNTFTFFIWGFYGMLTSCGVPVLIAGMFQTIAFFIMSIGVFQILTGRGMKGYE